MFLVLFLTSCVAYKFQIYVSSFNRKLVGILLVSCRSNATTGNVCSKAGTCICGTCECTPRQVTVLMCNLKFTNQFLMLLVVLPLCWSIPPYGSFPCSKRGLFSRVNPIAGELQYTFACSTLPLNHLCRTYQSREHTSRVNIPVT